MKILLGSVGLVTILVLAIVIVIAAKIFGKPLGFLLKIAGILIGLAIVAAAIICSLPYLLLGVLIFGLGFILMKLLLHKSKG